MEIPELIISIHGSDHLEKKFSQNLGNSGNNNNNLANTGINHTSYGDEFHLNSSQHVSSRLNVNKNYYQNIIKYNKIKQFIGNGIIKSAEECNALIITGGLNMGSSKLIGSALKDHRKKNISNLKILGVSSWGNVRNNHTLVNNNNNNSNSSNNNTEYRENLKEKSYNNNFSSKYDVIDEHDELDDEKIGLTMSPSLTLNQSSFEQCSHPVINKKNFSSTTVYHNNPAPNFEFKESKSNFSEFINPEFDYFLFIDDGFEGRYNRELKFRKNLERKLSRLEKIDKTVPTIYEISQKQNSTNFKDPPSK